MIKFFLIRPIVVFHKMLSFTEFDYHKENGQIVKNKTTSVYLEFGINALRFKEMTSRFYFP